MRIRDRRVIKLGPVTLHAKGMRYVQIRQWVRALDLIRLEEERLIEEEKKTGSGNTFEVDEPSTPPTDPPPETEGVAEAEVPKKRAIRQESEKFDLAMCEAFEEILKAIDARPGANVEDTSGSVDDAIEAVYDGRIEILAASMLVNELLSRDAEKK